MGIFTCFNAKKMSSEKYYNEVIARVTKTAEGNPIAKIYLPVVQKLLEQQLRDVYKLLKRKTIPTDKIDEVFLKLEAALAAVAETKKARKTQSQEEKKLTESLQRLTNTRKRLTDLPPSLQKEIAEQMGVVAAEVKRYDKHSKNNAMKLISKKTLCCYLSFHEYVLTVLSAMTKYDSTFFLVDKLQIAFAKLNDLPSNQEDDIKWLSELGLADIPDIEQILNETDFTKQVDFTDVSQLIRVLVKRCASDPRGDSDAMTEALDGLANATQEFRRIVEEMTQHNPVTKLSK